MRAHLAGELIGLARDHAPFALEVTPRSIVLDDEPVFVADNSNAPTGELALEHELSWILHRDGIRTLRFAPGLTDHEAGTLLDALLISAPASATHEDIVTLLWEAGLEHVRVSTEEFGPVRVNPLLIRRDDGPVPHVNDRPLPEAALTDVRRLWPELSADELAELRAFRVAWAAERAIPFSIGAKEFVVRMFERDLRPEMTDALAAALVTWIATCAQRSDWQEALTANELLRRVDPDGRRSAPGLTQAFQSLDMSAITERLDESEVREQSRLFAFVVRVGAPALPLLASALSLSGKARVRAGISTALAYAFADDPEPLGGLLGDSRWYFVRNVVFVLGQIGGARVVPPLAVAARHVDLRVRRAAIHALGQVPPPLRRDVLLAQLDHGDARLVAAALTMLAREPDPVVIKALLARLRAPEFEHRPEEQKAAMLFTLADLGGDEVVAALEQILVRGGWFSRRSPERMAAARALARVGTEAARSVLEQGRLHRSDSVREACEEALAQRGRA